MPPLLYLCFIIGIWHLRPPVHVAEIMMKPSFIVLEMADFLATFGTKLVSQVLTSSLFKMLMTGSKIAPQITAPLSFLPVFGGFGTTI